MSGTLITNATTSRKRSLLPLALARVPAGLALALAQEGVATIEHGLAENDARFVLFDSLLGSEPDLATGQTAIDVAPLRNSSGPDPFLALIDRQSARQNWHIRGWTLGEDVSRFNKRAIRLAMTTGLRAMIEAAGGLWARVAAFPFPYRSAFNLRLDHDEYDQADFDRLLGVIAPAAEATSHFLCASTHECHPDALARLRELDVGSHGYWHHTYHDPRENLRNVRRGIESLRRAGIEPSGFVAPLGRFNRGLQAALDELGVTHSSEFALAYDEWPFWPEQSRVLQIPVHPVCLGLFCEAAAGSGAAALSSAVSAAGEYLAETARQKHAAGEPLWFYGHPNGRLGRFPEVVRRLLDTVDDLGGVWRSSLSQVRDWWQARSEVAWSLRGGPNEYTLQVRHLPAQWRVAIEVWRGTHVAVLPLRVGETRFTADALAYQSRGIVPRAEPVRVDAPHPVRRRVKQWLDWEKTTPVDEISTATWPGWFKQQVRRLRG